MSYTQILRDLLDHQYPSYNETKTIIINTLQLHILPAPARPYFLRYEHLETLALNKCDLRNLENFPKILTLKYLDLSDNSLQGSLNYLMPLSGLVYLSIANNLIGDFRKLLPLQMIDGLEVYVAGNPFIDGGQVWKNKIKQYGIKVVKEPKKLELATSKVKQEEEKKPEKKQNEEEIKDKPEQIHPRLGMGMLFRDLSDISGHPNGSIMMVRRKMRPGSNEDNPFTSGLRMMRSSEDQLRQIFKSQNSDSQQLNEEEEDESQNDFLENREGEDFNNEDFQPLLDVFEDEGLQINDEDDDEQPDEQHDEHSLESS